jgi:hypothetical protein
MDTQTKIRYRPHFGSHVECLYDLTGYGIPLNSLPITTGGELLKDEHLKWIEKRRSLEIERMRIATHTSSPMTAVMAPSNTVGSGSLPPQPGEKDVLFGRGKTVADAPGNIKFRQLIEIYMDKYEAAGRLEKTCIADLIVRIVKDANGGRFLKREDGDDFWVEVDDTTARKKVAHAFRNRRKPQKPLP